MLNTARHISKTLYRNAFVTGAAIPPEQSWRAYMPIVVGLLSLALFSGIIFTEPNIELWRLLLSWSLIGASLLSIFVGFAWIQGFRRRNEVSAETREVHGADTSNYVKISIAVALIAPPIVRLVLSLSGWQP